jgi:signal transduction histidine kinase
MHPPNPCAFRADRGVRLAALVLLADTATLAVVAVRDGAVGEAERAALTWALGAVAWAALGFRHRWPVPVAAVTLLAGAVYYPAALVDGLTPITAYVIALYTVARAGRLAAAVTLAAVTMLAISYSELVLAPGERNVNNMSIVLLSGWLVGLIATAHALRVRQAYLYEVEQRALAAERERDVRARQSATEERLRLARELHDVLGHNISLINVQASAAVHRSAKRPGETAELLSALTFVRDTSKEALRELRATLGVLRRVDEDAPTAPAAGLERLGELAARAERAGATGLKVTVETAGTPAVVPPQISLAAYRIVQESLTNVTRHAPGATRTRVRVAYAPGELRLSIDDDGESAPASDGATGSGISGMAERARALGGELTAGATGNGFRVTARLPLDA